MAVQVTKRWEPQFGAGLPRRDRQGCEYEAYVPDRLGGRQFLLHGQVAADVTDAEAAIHELNMEARSLVDSESIARLLLRAEAVASSKIEGLEVGGRRLLQAEVSRSLGDDVTDVTAEEVLGNIAAMAWAIELSESHDPISTDHLLEIHRRLLKGTRLAREGGRIRTSQNWIGGSSHNPCAAEFVPPPPELVEPLLDDLCAFCNGDDLPAVAQAAIAHAQFETIHPFVDGNGRTGRALIHIILRRRKLASRVLPPVSLVLATWSVDYVAALNGTRYLGDPNGVGAVDAINRWVGLFGGACRRAVEDAKSYERTVDELKRQWRTRLGRVRSGSAADLLLEALPGSPVLTVGAAAALVDRSFQAANEAVAHLVQAEVLRPIKVGRRNRAFEAPDVIEAVNDLERRLVSPTGDTHTGPPSRRVPARRPDRR